MIGYNVNEINTLMKEIADAYNNLGIYTEEQWKGLLYTLQGQWIGEDEQDFEKKLAERICKLYDDACTLAENAVKTVEATAEAWRSFQQKNNLDGSQIAGDAKFDIQTPKITRNSKIVSANIKTIANNANRGLQSESSSQLIKGKVSEFVKAVQDKTKGLFEPIETSKAFMGNQSTAIKTYVERVGVSIGEVTSAVQDMYDALDNLVSANYKTSVEDLSQQFAQAASDAESSTSGYNVWNGE